MRDTDELREIVREVVQNVLDERRSTEQLASDDPDRWAYEVMTGHDVVSAKQDQLAPREYVEEITGVDATECSSLDEYRRRVSEARGETS